MTVEVGKCPFCPNKRKRYKSQQSLSQHITRGHGRTFMKRFKDMDY